jgi:hypothetical protein
MATGSACVTRWVWLGPLTPALACRPGCLRGRLRSFVLLRSRFCPPRHVEPLEDGAHTIVCGDGLHLAWSK